MAEKKVAPTFLPVELHSWIKREALDRNSTIGAELALAVRLLQAQRAQEAAPAVRSPRRAVKAVQP